MGWELLQKLPYTVSLTNRVHVRNFVFRKSTEIQMHLETERERVLWRDHFSRVWRKYFYWIIYTPDQVWVQVVPKYIPPMHNQNRHHFGNASGDLRTREKKEILFPRIYHWDPLLNVCCQLQEMTVLERIWGRPTVLRHVLTCCCLTKGNYDIPSWKYYFINCWRPKLNAAGKKLGDEKNRNLCEGKHGCLWFVIHYETWKKAKPWDVCEVGQNFAVLNFRYFSENLKNFCEYIQGTIQHKWITNFSIHLWDFNISEN